MIEGCWSQFPKLRPLARTINGILTNILITPGNIMQVYDRKYAHYLDINKSVCNSDFDPSHYIDNKCFYHDNTTVSVSSKQRRRASVSRHDSDAENQLSPNSFAAASIVAQHFDKLHTEDTAIQPRGMLSFMSSIGNHLINSVKSKNKVTPIVPTLLPVEEISVVQSSNATPVRSVSNSPRGNDDLVPVKTSNRIMGVFNSIKNVLSPRSPNM